MINLLPPHVKEQVSYSQHNRTINYYIWLLVVLIAVIGASFIGVWLYLSSQVAAVDVKLSEKQEQINSYKDLETKAKDLADRLKAIDKAQSDRNKFSSLLTEIATLTPKNVYIFSINIGQDTTQPIKILAYGTDYTSAVSLRNSLATNKRFSNVDITDVNQGTDPYTNQASYKINLLVGLKQGAIK